MDGLLRVNNPNLQASSSSAYLADDTTSTCALITPSPPTNALVNPLPEEEEPSNFIDAQELVSKLKKVKDDDDSDKKSSSSSNCSLAPLPSATLLNNNLNHYLHIAKDEDAVTQEAPGKTQPLQMTFRNPPENYFFMKWNWVLIRKISAWTFLAGMLGMLAVVVAMIWTLPKSCNPATQWYQGNLMYEVFPASFADSDNNGVGDFKGLSLNVDYLQELGVRILRLNSIFPSNNYPEDYMNVTSLMAVAPELGDMKDFTTMVNILHKKNISIVLDLPLSFFLKKSGTPNTNLLDVSKKNLSGTARTDMNSLIKITETIEFWLQEGVDGFYLKGLEHLSEDESFPDSLKQWKKLLGSEKALIVSNVLLNVAPKKYHNTIYANVDLIDTRLPVDEGTKKLNKFLSKTFNDTLFSKASMPWILWSISDVTTSRLANRLRFGNESLGATLLQLMLPGTPCIFYGDEIGMRNIQDPHEDRKDIQHLHHLSPMVWEHPNKQFTRKDTFAWMPGSQSAPRFDQLKIIAKAVELRSQSPSIYVNSVNREGVNKANAEVKYTDSNMLMVQRWYPRRKSYVVLSNMEHTGIVADLSKLLYSGQIVVGPRPDSQSDSISFKDISLWPGESIIVYVS